MGHYQLPITNYLLPITYYQLPITNSRYYLKSLNFKSIDFPNILIWLFFEPHPASNRVHQQ
ncbi:MAG: hypothetical protein EAZ98_00025 [Oscillatoriales cyanobacterium]|nr:MAG: hypothetical protein EAZ98_00025 [Oscillatoriales cyanobacterium]